MFATLFYHVPSNVFSQSKMDFRKAKILEGYAGQDAINWIAAHTVTKGTELYNEELLWETIQFHQYLVEGRISFRIPDRLEGLIAQRRQSSISFEATNVCDVCIFEYPDIKGAEIQTVISMKNGADLCIVSNRKGKVVEVRASLDKLSA